MAANGKILETQNIIGLKVQGITGSSLPMIQILICATHNQVVLIQKIFRLWKAIIQLMSCNAGFCFDFDLINQSLALNSEAVPVLEKFITILKSDKRVEAERIISVIKPIILRDRDELPASRKNQVKVDINNRTPEKILGQGNMPPGAFFSAILGQILRQGSMRHRTSVLTRAIPGQTKPENNLAMKYPGRVTETGNSYINIKRDADEIIFSIPSRSVKFTAQDQAKAKAILERVNRDNYAIKPVMIGFLNNMKVMSGMLSVASVLKRHQGLGYFAGPKKNSPKTVVGPVRDREVFHSKTQSLLEGIGNDNIGRTVKYPSQLTTEVNRDTAGGVIKKAGEQSYSDFERKSNALMDRRRRLSFNGG